jgi:plastocyanin
MKRLLFAALLVGCAQHQQQQPDLTVGGKPRASVVVMTVALATKEGGPKETVAAFGEVYAFSPTTIEVHRDEPTEITFWNLQADDAHDFMLLNDRNKVLAKFDLPALKKTTVVYTFHRDGLYRFVCAMHRPEMSGAIIVLPAAM